MAEDLRNNENRARFKNDSINTMTLRSADGSIAGGMRFDPAKSVPGNEMPPGILGPAGLLRDPHAGGRHSYDNLTTKPGIEGGRGAETRRRLYDRDVKYR
jgi:hypothetical protein